MPTFTGNLKTVGIEPRNGLFPELTFTLQQAGLDQLTGSIYAGSKSVTPNADGSFSVELAATVGLVPETRVKLTGSWLGDDEFFELPSFHVPESGGTLGGVITAAGPFLTWIGLEPPPLPGPFTSWLVQDPTDPTREPTYPGVLLGDFLEWS